MQHVLYFYSQSKENEEMRITLAELSNSSSSSGPGHGGGRGGGGRGGGGDFDDLDRDRDGEVWCVQDRRVYEQGDDWEVDSCTSCTCKVSIEQFFFFCNYNILAVKCFLEECRMQVSN